MKWAVTALIVWLAAAVVPAHAQVRIIDNVPIPLDAKVTHPGYRVPPSSGPFPGVWTGTWGGQLDHILIVERIEPGGKAHIIYAWGNNKRLGISSGWRRLTGRIEGLKLHVTADFKVTYRLVSSQTIDARWTRGERSLRAELSKAGDEILSRGKIQNTTKLKPTGHP